jgi:leucyl/phenylalanyl-tRNA--protein transferase
VPASHLPGWDAFRLRAAAPKDGPVAFCADLGPASVLAACRLGLFPVPAVGDYARTLNEVRYEDRAQRRKRLRRGELTTTADTAFLQVAEARRAGRKPRWLTDELLAALHAHSIEVWLDGTLISGDSLFGRHPGAAAVAVADMQARLTSAGGTLIDAQWDSPFLRSLGARTVPRASFQSLLGPPLPALPIPGCPLPARRLLGSRS